jgi:murein DD-endopeptidase MepM/ murein hydrolase activator NlpD
MQLRDRSRTHGDYVAVLLAVCVLFVLAPSRANAAPPADTPVTYTVQAGDTLSLIAQRYHTTVATLKQLNGLGNSDLIQIGQKLIVPSAESSAPVPAPASAMTAYIIQPGDSLYRIALRHGTTARAIEQLNGIPNPNLLTVGQAVTIPSNPSVVKPGLVIDPPSPRQGNTVLIEIARADVASISGAFNGEKIPFVRAGGYFYGLASISRCAKIGSFPLTLKQTDASGISSTQSVTLTIAATAFPVQAITLPPSKGAILTDRKLVETEAAQLQALVEQYTPTRLWSGAFRQPVYGAITSQFGSRRSYNGGPVGACGHEGTDFDVESGDPVFAPARGRVVFAALTQVRGNMVILDHGIGVFSGYYHLSAIDAQVGKIVEPGTVIGKVGSTGLSTGPHLHWSMWVNGEYVDPMEWTRRVLP